MNFAFTYQIPSKLTRHHIRTFPLCQLFVYNFKKYNHIWQLASPLSKCASLDANVPPALQIFYIIAILLVLSIGAYFDISLSYFLKKNSNTLGHGQSKLFKLMYSTVSNTRVGGNKHVGWKFSFWNKNVGLNKHGG